MSDATAQDNTIDPPQYGPKMLALPNDKWRNFVVALFDDGAPTKGLLLYAARMAGVGTPTSSSKSIGVMAARICHDKRTQQAIAEYSVAAVRGGLAPDVVRGIRNVVNDPRHRDHAKILSLVYSRLDPEQTLVKVQDERPAQFVAATKEVLDRIEAIAKKYNLGWPSPQIIDGECSSDVTEQAPA
jgi:hypothetical protein